MYEFAKVALLAHRLELVGGGGCCLHQIDMFATVSHALIYSDGSLPVSLNRAQVDPFRK